MMRLNSASRPSPPSFPLNGDDLPDGIFLSDFQQGEIVSDLFRAACNMRLEGPGLKAMERPMAKQRSLRITAILSPRFFGIRVRLHKSAEARLHRAARILPVDQRRFL
jgi:hypothetical protein